MNTKHLIAPELAPALEGMPLLNPTAESLPALRLAVAASPPAGAPPAPGVTVEQRLLPRPDGSTCAFWFICLPRQRSRVGCFNFTAA